MKIQIEDNLYIESNALCFQIVKYGTKFDKEKGVDVETRESLGDFMTVNSCARHIATQLKVRESTATTLHELIKDVASIQKYIDSKINF